MIDLTHKLGEEISVYPGTAQPNITQTNNIEEHGYALISMHIGTHTGTHIDAPCHIVPGKRSLDQYPIDFFIGSAYVLDCTDRSEITKELLEKHATEIAESEFLLFYAGWHHKWNTEAYFDAYPVLNEEACQYLLNFNLKAVGFDSISADPVGCMEIANHKFLLGNDILIMENLNNLEKLNGKKFELNCIPLLIKDSDGSTVRVFARNIK
ncbi:MAG: hypothetical protein CL663_08235 [Bacteroidetes bacterium]|nr:hypothetical protein [Bacteroidota bacterium]